MLHLPTPMLMGAPQGKTYDDFVAHITALATNGSTSWTNNVQLSPGGYRSTAAPFAGFSQMRGSIWMNYALSGVPPSRLAQHGLPSEAIYNAQAAAGYQIFFRLTSAGNQYSYYSLTRNGYTSEVYYDDPPLPAVYCTELIRWDGMKAWKSNPSIGGAETEYTW